ncbi:MAG TPA: hypothetical protein VGO47_05845, partial [Chlamydiales bacterium]|nr:hypothetical protein [Chlamydiales bacterium]
MGKLTKGNVLAYIILVLLHRYNFRLRAENTRHWQLYRYLQDAPPTKAANTCKECWIQVRIV